MLDKIPKLWYNIRINKYVIIFIKAEKEAANIKMEQSVVVTRTAFKIVKHHYFYLYNTINICVDDKTLSIDIKYRGNVIEKKIRLINNNDYLTIIQNLNDTDFDNDSEKLQEVIALLKFNHTNRFCTPLVVEKVYQSVIENYVLANVAFQEFLTKNYKMRTIRNQKVGNHIFLEKKITLEDFGFICLAKYSKIVKRTSFTVHRKIARSGTLEREAAITVGSGDSPHDKQVFLMVDVLNRAFEPGSVESTLKRFLKNPIVL